MKRRRVASFEALIGTRYGAGSPSPKRIVKTSHDLLQGHYGSPTKKRCKPDGPVASAMGHDDGEVLQQRRARGGFSGARSAAFTPATAFTMSDQPKAKPAHTPAGDDAHGLPDNERARQERLLDFAAPAPPAPEVPAVHAPVPPPVPAVPPAAAPLPVMPPPPQPMPVPPIAPPPETQVFPPAPAPAAGQPEGEDEDGFLADMRAIMSGRKSYDPTTKRMIDRHGMTAPPEARDDVPRPPAAPPSANPAPSPAHDIFQRIAQSMEYAGAYDLGVVDLENRFAQFDQAEDARRAKPGGPTAGTAPHIPPPPPAPPVPKADPEDYRADLQDMLQRPTTPPPPKPPSTDTLMPGHGAEGGPAPSPPPATPLSLGNGRLPGYARPLYDTGEHVLAGDTLYPDQLRVGRAPGVTFSYGDIIAMADLYQTDEQMMSASTDELTKLKAKIDASTAHYRATTGQRPPAPGSADWSAVIGERYLRLAEDNFTHFAPNIFFPDKAFAAKVGNNSNHRTEWEKYHLRAIEEAQRLARDPALQGRSFVPESALIINAFGDHFLTDAFSSGHVINKAEVMGMFIAKFYSGDKLNAAGEAFFGKVASKAFRGVLKEKFSALETFEPYILWWNPNIDSVSRFTSLLIQIGNDPAIGKGKVVNLAVKALHDKLNDSGIMVTNGRGASPWRLYGDENLSKSPTTLTIMRQAVEQSAANILDHGILVSNLDPAPYFDKVWSYVPVLTSAAHAEFVRVMPSYIDPGSDELANKAADILYDEVDTLIAELIKAKKLQKA